MTFRGIVNTIRRPSLLAIAILKSYRRDMIRATVKHAMLLAICTGVAIAQSRPVVDTIPASAAQALASIVAAYQKEVAANPRNAELWHDLGMNAWRLQSALSKGSNPGTEPARIGRLADS